MKKNYEDYGYKVKHGILAFQKGPLSQWWGGGREGQKHDFTYVSPFHEGTKITFSSCEQFMMFSKAMIFEDFATAHKIMEAISPKEQKALGRKVENFDGKAWDEKKFEIVKIGNILKFSQNPDLMDFLVGTDGLKLVEAAPWDKIWGCGTDLEDPRTYSENMWQGENLLGKALMEARQRIINVNNGEEV